MTPAVRVENFFARVQDLHRPARFLREQRDAKLEIERLRLAAERAADRGLDDADAGDVEIEHARELAVQVVRHLGRAPHGEHTGGIVVADRAVRLDRRVRRALEEVITLDYDVRAAECGIDISELQVHVLRDVAIATRLAGVVELRRVGFERALGLEDRLEHFVLDADQPKRAVRRFFIDGRDRGDAITDVAGAVDAQRVLVTRPGNDAVLDGHFAAGSDRVHAGQRFRFARVNGDDARVRVRRAQDLAVQHARKRHVVGIDGGARYLAVAIDLAQALTDDGELALHDVGELVRGQRVLFLARAQLLRSHDSCTFSAGTTGGLWPGGTGLARGGSGF